MLSKFSLSRYGMMRWQANNDGGTGAGGTSDDGNADKGKNDDKGKGDPQSFATFGEWYESLKDDQKALAAPAKEHFDRLYSTVRTVRDERDDFQRQLKAATAKLKEGSEERTTFEQLSAQLDSANQRADFYEEAPSHNCLNPKAAFALALSSQLIDAKKGVDWKALQEEAPQLFGDGKRKLPKKGNAGNGTGSERAEGLSMNDWIRRSAGVRQTTQGE